VATIKAEKDVVVDKLLNAIKFKIEGNIAALKLTEMMFQSSNSVDRHEFNKFAKGVLELYPEVKALEWLPIVKHEERENYERSVQKEGFPDYKITQKNENNQLVSADKRAFYTPVHYVAPFQGNEKAFGLDSRSNLMAKDAIEIALKSGKMAITVPTVLVQENQSQYFILMYQPHFSVEQQRVTGLVVLILRMNDFIESLKSFDTFSEHAEYRLYDAVYKDRPITQSVKFFHTTKNWYLIARQLKVANRDWNLDVNFNIEQDFGFQQGKFWSWVFVFFGFTLAFLVSFMVYSRLKFKEDRTKSAIAFSNEEERYQKLLNSSADAYFLQDMNGNLLDINRVACETMGYSREELLQMNVMEINVLIDGATKQDYIDYFNKFPKGKTVQRELLYKKKDGTFFPVELSMNKFTYNNEDVLSGFIRDISDRKEYENSLNQARIIAEEANSAKSEFLTKMSHEFRTPMHSILSFSEMGLKRLNKVPLEKLGSYFNNIQKSGNRLMKLLNNLLDLAKLETGKLKYCFEKRSLSLILEDCIAEQALQLKHRNIKMDIKKQVTVDNVVCDIDKIRQVITNLLSNAVKFTKQNSTIHISIEEDDNSLATKAIRFCIRDEGSGIPKDELKDIFDKFVQSSKISSNLGGTGLGLAICSEIITGHRGKIWAENEICGASLKFVIPINPNQS
jgi:PAS domain S-box-containing protein